MFSSAKKWNVLSLQMTKMCKGFSSRASSLGMQSGLVALFGMIWVVYARFRGGSRLSLLSRGIHALFVHPVILNTCRLIDGGPTLERGGPRRPEINVTLFLRVFVYIV